MPALDDCAPQVVRALHKAGWLVSPKPERKLLEHRVAYIDLVARNEQESAYIEVKCFPAAAVGGASTPEEYTAVGQYIIYRTLLELIGDSTPLYLAVPNSIFQEFDPVMLKTFNDYHIRILLIDTEAEVVLKWIG